VYRALCEEAGDALACGQAVIADAVFLRAEERAAIGEVARLAGAPFLGVWLEASPGSLEERLERRRGDASDATVEVLRSQQAVTTGPIAWRRLDATPREPERVLEKARAALVEALP
jgi:predicted kinase